jgi:PIN domain nuclease of toxin-antitoxin system
MLNLDTHILLYALEGKLTPREIKRLERERWGISAIVLWEITKLYQKGRIAMGLDSPMLSRAIAAVEVWPISREVCLNLLRLDFASDPADEIIAATSLAY